MRQRSRVIAGISFLLASVGCPSKSAPPPTPPTKSAPAEEAPAEEAPAEEAPAEETAEATTTAPQPGATAKGPAIRLSDLTGGARVDDVDASIGHATVKAPRRARSRAPRSSAAGSRLPARAATKLDAVVDEELATLLKSRKGKKLTDSETEAVTTRIMERTSGQHTEREVKLALSMGSLRFLKKTLEPLAALAKDLPPDTSAEKAKKAKLQRIADEEVAKVAKQLEGKQPGKNWRKEAEQRNAAIRAQIVRRTGGTYTKLEINLAMSKAWGKAFDR